MYRRNYMDGLFPNTSSIGVIPQDPDHDKIINEAIILDSFNGNFNALHEFYSNIGKFGARDGILNEAAEETIKINTVTADSTADTASVLASAKEANDSDYDLYTKCILLMQKCMDNMKSKYGNIAEKRVEEQKQVLKDNPRVQDAIEKTEEKTECTL